MNHKCKILSKGTIVKELAKNEIFVFGSNTRGYHGYNIRGEASETGWENTSAGYAVKHFGAKENVAYGPQGQSYGIPTYLAHSDDVLKYVNIFLRYAENHPDLQFIVTRIGTGNAKWEDKHIAPMFRKALDMENITLPEEFIVELENGAEYIPLPNPDESIRRTLNEVQLESMQSFEYHGDCIERNFILSDDQTILFRVNESFKGDNDSRCFTIPNTVKRIYEGAFRRCVELEQIIVPDSVTDIESSAFHGCRNLTSLKISEGRHISIKGGIAAFRGTPLEDDADFKHKVDELVFRNPNRNSTERIDYEIGYGVISFSHEVNQIDMHSREEERFAKSITNELLDNLHNYIKSLLKKYNLTALTLQKVEGIYKSSREMSNELKIVGVCKSVLVDIAKDICINFLQESIMLQYTESDGRTMVMFVNIPKERLNLEFINYIEKYKDDQK